MSRTSYRHPPRRWWTTRVNLRVSRISLSLSDGGDRQFLKRSTFGPVLLDASLIVPWRARARNVSRPIKGEHRFNRGFRLSAAAVVAEASDINLVLRGSSFLRKEWEAIAILSSPLPFVAIHAGRFTYSLLGFLPIRTIHSVSPPFPRRCRRPSHDPTNMRIYAFTRARLKKRRFTFPVWNSVSKWERLFCCREIVDPWDEFPSDTHCDF